MKFQLIVTLMVLVSLMIINPVFAGDSQVNASDVFEFSSGGAYHIQGHGEWIIKLTGAGNFSVKHNVKGKIKNFGDFKLSENEKSGTWKVVRGLNVDKMKTSTRPGVPDEVQYTFSLKTKSGSYSAKIWVNDLRDKAEVKQFLNQVKILIKKYVGKDAVLN